MRLNVSFRREEKGGGMEVDGVGRGGGGVGE